MNNIDIHNHLLNLSKVYKSCIIVEGNISDYTYLINSNSSKKILKLSNSIDVFSSQIETNLESNDNIYVMTKNYINTNHIPNTTSEELLLSIRDILKKFESLKTQRSNVAISIAFIKKIGVIKNQEFSIKDLPSEIRQLIWEMICNRSFHFLTSTDKIFQRIRSLDERSSFIYWKSFTHPKVNNSFFIPAYNCSKTKEIIAFSDWVRTEIGGATTINLSSDDVANVNNQLKINGAFDITTPVLNNTENVLVQYSTTIGEFINKINKQIELRKINSGIFEVNPAFKNKPIYVIGDNNSNTLQIINNICKIYNFKIFKTDNGLYISKEKPTRFNTTETIMQQCIDVFPSSIMNYINQNLTIKDKNLVNLPPIENYTKNINICRNKLYLNTVARFRNSIDKIFRSFNSKIDVLSLSTTQKNYVSLILYVDIIYELFNYNNSINFPKYISNFENDTINISIKQEGNRYILNFLIQNNNNNKKTGGFSGEIGIPKDALNAKLR